MQLSVRRWTKVILWNCEYIRRPYASFKSLRLWPEELSVVTLRKNLPFLVRLCHAVMDVWMLLMHHSESNKASRRFPGKAVIIKPVCTRCRNNARKWLYGPDGCSLLPNWHPFLSVASLSTSDAFSWNGSTRASRAGLRVLGVLLREIIAILFICCRKVDVDSKVIESRCSLFWRSYWSSQCCCSSWEDNLLFFCLTTQLKAKRHIPSVHADGALFTMVHTRPHFLFQTSPFQVQGLSSHLSCCYHICLFFRL